MKYKLLSIMCGRSVACFKGTMEVKEEHLRLSEDELFNSEDPNIIDVEMQGLLNRLRNGERLIFSAVDEGDVVVALDDVSFEDMFEELREGYINDYSSAVHQEMEPIIDKLKLSTTFNEPIFF